MTQRVLSTKTELIPELWSIKKAIKNTETGRWDCDLLYDGSKLLFLTPRCKLGSSGELNFNIQSKKKFVDFIENIENQVVINLVTNCESIFNGKKFTEERLKGSLEPCIDISENGVVTFNSLLCNENLRCFDIEGIPCSLKNVGNYVSAYVIIDKISFTKELFKICFKTTCLKQSRVKGSANFDTEQNEPVPIDPEHLIKVEDPDSFFD